MKLIVVMLAGCLMLAGCMEQKPIEADGRSAVRLVAKADTSSDLAASWVIPAANAQVLLSSEYGILNGQTNSVGIAEINGLPASTYAVSIRMIHPLDPTIYFVGAREKIDLISSIATVETLILLPVSASGIVINEIYAAGPVNGIFYFYDQYIEIYNASSETKYLDGAQFIRMSGNNEAGQHGPGYDEHGDGQIQGVTYIFVVPGVPGGTQYPILSGQFKVMASTGADHTKQVAVSFDLSHADWEFYNQFSATDLDNPNVPNLINKRSDRTVDFLINLSSDIIVMADGTDSTWSDGIKIGSVLDAVEYKSIVTGRKTLDPRCDRSFVIGPAKYSGRSIQRRSPGMDSNNSRFDFEATARATPGKQ